MTLTEMKNLIEACTYKPGWAISFTYGGGARPHIQISATTPCSSTGVMTQWRSAKTYLSQHMCRQEIVAAVYGAIEKAELHEIREFFRYKGASIFNPHIDPDALVTLAKREESFNIRENAMSMEEPCT